jgi:hypothetical protein
MDEKNSPNVSVAFVMRCRAGFRAGVGGKIGYRGSAADPGPELSPLLKSHSDILYTRASRCVELKRLAK